MNLAFSIVLLFTLLDCVTNETSLALKGVSCSINCVLPAGKSVNGKILSYEFHPKAAYFECKFGIFGIYSRSKLTNSTSEGWILRK